MGWATRGLALRFELLHERDVGLHGGVFGGAAPRGPGVVFGSALEVEHAGAGAFDVALRGLFIQGIQLEEPIGRRRLGQLFDPRLGGLKVFFEGHAG
jgi:hypothetical protein